MKLRGELWKIAMHRDGAWHYISEFDTRDSLEMSTLAHLVHHHTSAQQPPEPPVTAIEDWVLARARAVPSRTPAQLRQLQFHWGNPPPAADPSTRIFTAPL